MDEILNDESNGSQSSEPASRSTIKFPYGDLKEATGMAREVHDKFGFQCGLDQLAAQIGMTTSSGSFRTKLATARSFGLFSGRRGTQVELTDLGRRIVDPSQAGAAKVEAFLNVPLYQSLHDRHNGGLLPGDSGIEEEMIQLGVTRKSAGRARQAFQRSAEYAGFFRQGRNRLVVPPLDTISEPVLEAEESQKPHKEVTQEAQHPGTDSRAHPLLEGLWASLPPQGEAFSLEQQSDWIQMAELALKMVYGGTRDDKEPF